MEREHQDRDPRKRAEPERSGDKGREVAPPIEREHETYAGIFEEEERRRERERG